MSISMFIKICISFFSIILFIVIAYISYAQVNIYKVIWRERFLDEKHFLEVYNFQDNKIKIYDNYEVIVKPLFGYEIDVTKYVFDLSEITDNNPAILGIAIISAL